MVGPHPVAPCERAIDPVGYQKTAPGREAAARLYGELLAAGFDVLLDDRDERPGVMFADCELTGIPHRVVIGDRGLKEGKAEYQARRDSQATPVAMPELAGLGRPHLPGRTFPSGSRPDCTCVSHCFGCGPGTCT